MSSFENGFFEKGNESDKEDQQEYSLDELIEKRESDFIVDNLDKFKNVSNQKIALRLIENDSTSALLSNLGKFQEINYEEIFLKIVDQKGISYSDLLMHLGEFRHLTQEIAMQLIEAGKVKRVILHLDSFDNLDYEQICLKLIEKEEAPNRCFPFIEECKIGEISPDIAYRLVEQNEGWGVMRNLEKFKGVNLEFLSKLIETRQFDVFVQNLNKFKDIDLQFILLKIAESGDKENIFNHLEYIVYINQEVALKLLERGAHIESIRCIIDKIRFGVDFFEKVKLIYPEFLSKVEKEIPELAEQARKSPALAIEILSCEENFDDIKESIESNPFLLQALENNPRFGSKMLIKFKEFDETSKENISILYKDKAEILKKSPDIDTGSFEFRQSMQTRLLDYKNNHKIVSELTDTEFVKEAEDEIRKENSWIGENEEKIEKLVQAKLDTYKNKPEFADKAVDDEFMAKIEDEVLDENPDISAAIDRYDKMMKGIFDAYINSPDYEDKTKEGIKSLEWLNHDEVIEFTLGEEDVRFSEKVKTPINRIEEVLNKYKETISKILSEYSVELKAAVVANPEEEEVNKYIAGMEEQLSLAKDKGEDKKVIGIEKGIVNATSKLEKLKPINVWEKIQADMRRLSLMISEASAANGTCIEDEGKIQALLEEKNREQLIKAKGKLEKDERNLKEKFKTLESFMDTFGVNLEGNITGSLGNERAEALMQEINLEMAEDFSHYDADKKTLASIFGSEDEKNPLDGTDVSVRIASRDPDVDLYLGNYCPCCICIESEYHGEESPISDYVTDLGMQNVVVYDEKRKIPVVSCWCFIGEDRKIGEQVLVIDNIEANTAYSGNYPEQISKAIREYIEKYAKACKIERIIQGPDNNDLNIFDLGKVDMKLGGIYNRTSGYFLEAEKEEDEDDGDED